MPSVVNRLDGGTNSSAITATGSGGASGNPFDVTNLVASGTLIWDSTHARGPLALKAATGATAGRANVGWTASIGTQTTVWVRFYLYATANGNFAAGGIFLFRAFTGSTISAGTSRGGVGWNSSGHLCLFDSTGAVIAGTEMTSALTLNQWNLVEAKLTFSATAAIGSCELRAYPDDVATVPTFTGSNSGTANLGGTADSYGFGVNDSDPNVTAVWLDGIGVSTAGFMGHDVQPVVSGRQHPGGVPRRAGAVNAPRTFIRSATLEGVAATGNNVPLTLTALFSLAETLDGRQVDRPRTAAVAWTPLASRAITRDRAAACALLGTVPKTVGRGMSCSTALLSVRLSNPGPVKTQAFTLAASNVTRAPNAVRSSSVHLTATFPRAVARTISCATTLSALKLSGVQSSRTCATTLVSTVSRNPGRTVTAGTSIVASALVRNPGPVKTQTFTLTETHSRSVDRPRVVSITLVATDTRAIARTESAGIGVAATDVKAPARSLSAVIVWLASLSSSTSNTNHPLTLTSAFSLAATLSRSVDRPRAAVTAWQASYARALERSQVAATPLTASASRSVARPLTAATAFVATRRAGLARAITSALSWLASASPVKFIPPTSYEVGDGLLRERCNLSTLLEREPLFKETPAEPDSLLIVRYGGGVATGKAPDGRLLERIL